jgi:S1-C subfamily serine protease
MVLPTRPRDRRGCYDQRMIRFVIVLLVLAHPAWADATFDRAAALSPPPPGATRVGQGTGFFIAPTHLLTAAHLVQACRRIDIATATGPLLNAARVRADPDADVAILDVPVGQQSALGLAPRAPATDGPLTIIGYPDDNTTSAPSHIEAIGHNQAAHRFDPRNPASATELILQARIHHGDSGAPILDRSGRVIGLIQGITPDAAEVKSTYGLTQPNIAVGPGLAPIRRLLGPDVTSQPSGPTDTAVVRVLCWS